MDRAALINYLTHSVQTLHAEDQRLERVLRQVKAAQQVSPSDFEAIIEAQKTSLRIPANALLMLVGMMESQSEPARAAPHARGGTAPAPSVTLRAGAIWLLRGLIAALEREAVVRAT